MPCRLFGRVHKLLRRSVVAAVLLWFSPALAEVKTTFDVKFGPLPDQKLDLCAPSQPIEPKPAVLLIHGGGWVEGDKAAMRGLCSLFAHSGIVAATVGYRLANLENPSTRWPAQINDVSLAFKWVHDHASELGIDPARICSYGESAGGHLSVWLAIKEKRLACAIDGFGPANLSSLGPKFTKALDALLGKQRTEVDERSASPPFFLSRKLPPILIVQGNQDDLVLPEQSQQLYEAARQKNMSVKLITYPGGHSWRGLDHNIKLGINDEVLRFIRHARGH